MKRTQQFATLAVLIVSSIATSRHDFAQGRSTRQSLMYVLACHGVTSASTSLKDDGPKAVTGKSTDFLHIERYGRLLKVETNFSQYNGMDPKAKEILQTPDSYRVVSETGEGFVATFINGITTLHTLIINKSLTHGIWIESGFSFLEPQSEPISETVSLACTQEKQ